MDLPISIKRTCETLPLGIRLILLPFGLVFVLAGAHFFVQGIQQWRNWRSSRSWVATEATLTSLEIVGEQARCRYTYAFDGRLWEGGRVTWTPGWRGRDHCTTDILSALSAAKRQQQPLTCFVDPDQPQKVVLYRDLETQALAAPLYIGPLLSVAGAAVMTGGLYGWVGARRRARRCRAFPDQPWKWRSTWDNRELRPANRSVNLGMWIAALFFNAVAVPVVIVNVSQAMSHGGLSALWVPALGFLFLAVGAALLVVAISRCLRLRRFGKSRFVLDTMPAWIGKYLQGKLVLCGRLAQVSDPRVSLECIETFFTGGQQNVVPIWATQKACAPIDPPYGHTEAIVQVTIPVPEDCSPSDDSDLRDRIDWMLRITGSLPGADLDLCFEVPVFKPTKHDAARFRGHNS